MKSEKIFIEYDLINLAKARDFISRKAREAGASESDITRIEISCDEWNANIIEHALEKKSSRGFSIECKIDDGKFMIIYEHEGERFNPVDKEVVDVDEHFTETKERSLGLFIMREMMDEIHYEYINNRINRLILIKYIKGKLPNIQNQL